MKNSLVLSFIQSTTECFVCPVSFHLTLNRTKYFIMQERSVMDSYFLSPLMPQSKWFEFSPVWSDICWFFYLPVTASHHRKKFKFLPHLSHPAVTESSVSVQVARMLFYSVFLLFALIYFPSLVISKAEVSDWARCPQYVLWAFWVLSALLSGCLVCHYKPIFGSGTQIINCLTPRSDPYSLSYYFNKIPAFLGGIKPPTDGLTSNCTAESRHSGYAPPHKLYVPSQQEEIYCGGQIVFNEYWQFRSKMWKKKLLARKMKIKLLPTFTIINRQYLELQMLIFC